MAVSMRLISFVRYSPVAVLAFCLSRSSSRTLMASSIGTSILTNFRFGAVFLVLIGLLHPFYAVHESVLCKRLHCRSCASHFHHTTSVLFFWPQSWTTGRRQRNTCRVVD